MDSSKDPRFYSLKQMKKKLRIEVWKKNKGAQNQNEIDSIVSRMKEMTLELEREGKLKRRKYDEK